jgi:hypothetical protein
LDPAYRRVPRSVNGAIVTEPSPPRIAWAAAGSARIRLALALAVLVLASTHQGVAQPAGAPTGTWVLTRNTATLVAQADPDLARLLFDRPGAWVLGGWSGASLAMSWSSDTSFAQSVARGSIPAGVTAVMYDPEGWAPTPGWERRDPAQSMKAFAELAHREGYLVILTPHPNLTTEAGAVCGRRPGEPMEDAYLRCRIPAIAGRFADILDVQAQYLETDPMRYARIVDGAAYQARTANPNVVVLSQLSTTFTADPLALYRAWSAVHASVDGTYMGIPAGLRAEVAVAFLRMVSGGA